MSLLGECEMPEMSSGVKVTLPASLLTADASDERIMFWRSCLSMRRLHD